MTFLAHAKPTPGDLSWWATAPTTLLAAAFTMVLIYAAVVVMCRLQGVRSFAKMSSFDFAMTIAVGSIIASTALSGSTSLLLGAVVLATLFGCQGAVAWARTKSKAAEGVIDNTPILVFRNGAMRPEGMRKARLTEDDLYAKLREANALRPEDVQAVVVESTGDVSVLHGGEKLDPRLLEGLDKPGDEGGPGEENPRTAGDSD